MVFAGVAAFAVGGTTRIDSAMFARREGLLASASVSGAACGGRDSGGATAVTPVDAAAWVSTGTDETGAGAKGAEAVRCSCSTATGCWVGSSGAGAAFVGADASSISSSVRASRTLGGCWSK